MKGRERPNDLGLLYATCFQCPPVLSSPRPVSLTLLMDLRVQHRILLICCGTCSDRKMRTPDSGRVGFQGEPMTSVFMSLTASQAKRRGPLQKQGIHGAPDAVSEATAEQNLRLNHARVHTFTPETGAWEGDVWVESWRPGLERVSGCIFNHPQQPFLASGLHQRLWTVLHEGMPALAAALRRRKRRGTAGRGAARVHELGCFCPCKAQEEHQGHFSLQGPGALAAGAPGVWVRRLLLLLAGPHSHDVHAGVQGRLQLCLLSGAQVLACSLLFKSSGLSPAARGSSPGRR